MGNNLNFNSKTTKKVTLCCPESFKTPETPPLLNSELQASPVLPDLKFTATGLTPASTLKLLRLL